MKNGVEVILASDKRRHYNPEIKARIVAESFETGAKVATVARRHGVAPNLLYKWRKEFSGGKLSRSPDPGTALTQEQFVRVKVAAEEPGDHSIFVHLDGEVLVEIPVALGPQPIASLLKAIRG